MMHKKIIGIVLITLFSLCMITSLSEMRVALADSSLTTTRVLLFTNWDPQYQSAIAVSLGLDSRIKVTTWGYSNDTPGAVQQLSLSNYDVVVCDDFLPQASADRVWLHDAILGNNTGLLFFGGNYTMGMNEFTDLMPAYFNIDLTRLNSTVSDVLLGSSTSSGVMADYMNIVYNNTVAVQIRNDQIQVSVASEEAARPSQNQSIFSTNVAWQSCPLLRERVYTYARKPQAQTVVEVPDTKEPLVVTAQFSQITSTPSNASVLFISTGVGNITFDGGKSSSEMNIPFKLWPYFNYLMYMAVFYLNVHFNKANIESYAVWPYSPIPHNQESGWWMTFVAALWVFNFVLFFSLGRRKKSKDAATELAKEATAKEEKELAEKSGTSSSTKSDENTEKTEDEPEIDKPEDQDTNEAPSENSEE